MKGFRRMGPLEEEKREKLTHGDQENPQHPQKGPSPGVLPNCGGQIPTGS